MSNETLARLTAKFPITGRELGKPDVATVPSILQPIIQLMSGATLDSGFYRFHTPESARTGTQACSRLITGFEGRYYSFAFDWLGREVAVDIRPRPEDGYVIVVDPGAGEYLKTGCRLSDWHDAVASDEDPLAGTFYSEWRSQDTERGPLRFDQAVGYKIPLFLGGRDEVGNLEVVPRGLYFELCTQLAHGTRHMSPGETIDQVIIGS